MGLIVTTPLRTPLHGVTQKIFHPQWTHEPAGFSTVFDTDFDTLPKDGWIAQGTYSIVTDPTAPLSPGKTVVQLLYPAGFADGSGPCLIYNDLHLDTTDYFVGFYVRFSYAFNNHPVGTKLWYPFHSTANYVVDFSGGGLGPAGNVVMAMQMPAPQGGTYELVGQNNFSIDDGWWHKIEHYCKIGTSAGGGIMRWWMDEVLVGDYTNVQWPDAWGTWGEWRMSSVYGGFGGPSVAYDCYRWLDHIYLSRP